MTGGVVGTTGAIPQALLPIAAEPLAHYLGGDVPARAVSLILPVSWKVWIKRFLASTGFIVYTLQATSAIAGAPPGDVFFPQIFYRRSTRFFQNGSHYLVTMCWPIAQFV